ncbi:MAG: amidohydrolase family protein [Actinomycetota bacterium]
MKANPALQYFQSGVPSFEILHEALHSAIASAPKTTFIGAHVGGIPEDLQTLSQLLSELPNYFVDISARIADLGRQPRAFSALVEKHSDRILFGTDYFPFSIEGIRKYFRFLETDDEYFSYDVNTSSPRSGRWNIYWSEN